MIFTSGSTGVPKGVLVPARAMPHLVNRMQELYGFEPDDRFSKAYNLSFDGSVHDMFTSWNAGASLHPVPAKQLVAPRSSFRKAGLPSDFGAVNRRLPGADEDAPAGSVSLAALHNFLRRTAALPFGVGLRKRAACNSIVDNILGHTECCVFSTLERLSDTPNVTPNLGLVAIGKPLPGFEAAVFDEACTPLPPGARGTRTRRTPGGEGLLQDAERTAARFPPSMERHGTAPETSWTWTTSEAITTSVESIIKSRSWATASNWGKWNHTWPRSVIRTR